MPSVELADWSDRVRSALSRYDEPLLRLVAGRLFKPRIGQSAAELVEKAAETQSNAPVIDRRIRDLPDAAGVLLSLIGLSRQSRWKVGHLIALAAAAGHSDGFAPVQALLEAGLLFPEVRPKGPPVTTLDDWLGVSGVLSASVFAHPAVLARVRSAVPVPEFGTRNSEPTDRLYNPQSAIRNPQSSDGLEWLIRLAAVWQQVRATPIRLTQAQTLFKRDLGRLQSDPILAAPITEGAAGVPDPGVLALYWSIAAGLLTEDDHELRAGPFPSDWEGGLWPALTELYAAFFAVETWAPLAGYGLSDASLSPTPTAGLIVFALLADGGTQPRRTDDWVPAAEITAWLWEHHPSWAASLSKEVQKDRGALWVEAFIQAIAVPLRIAEAANANGWQFRLTEFGRYLLTGGPAPPAAPGFPQTLLVQPNAEILVYRQGLTPDLIANLSRFAVWKKIGPACTLELNAEETYKGLESGLSLGDMIQVLDRHGMRPVPPNVADLLRRWADKRDRITVYAAATLVEFATSADLDAAVGRGIVTVRLTDRIGLTSDGREPDFKHLRLIGNRDYDAKPQQCVLAADDGVTLTVDAAQSDLLLEAEIGRLADTVPGESPAVRTYRLTPETLRRATAAGFSLDELDRWFLVRTGEPLPPAARLFVVGPQVSPPVAGKLVVVLFPTAEIADGVTQWPATGSLVEKRLGPAALVVAEERLDEFRKVMEGIGIAVTING
jgi:hypothetical protein